MKSAVHGLNSGKDERIPPRVRLLAAAAELFYRHGIRAIGVDAVAEAADTNKMTLYRHFASKDELVAECLREFAREALQRWQRYEQAHPGDPRAQIHAWLAEVAGILADRNHRGCALANAAIELPDKAHPARRVVEEFKLAQRSYLAQLCKRAGLADPEMLADELYLLVEGARVTAQSIGTNGLGERMTRMGNAMIALHEARQSS
ncbi:MAG: helix-turn-helix domain-containing protein [Xanthobacteraceae bacterium]